jgi:hypothetical protein
MRHRSLAISNSPLWPSASGGIATVPLRVGCVGPWPEASGLGQNCLGETLDGSSLDLGVDGLGCLRVSGVRLTTNLELVRTREIRPREGDLTPCVDRSMLVWVGDRLLMVRGGCLMRRLLSPWKGCLTGLRIGLSTYLRMRPLNRLLTPTLPFDHRPLKKVGFGRGEINGIRGSLCV